MQAELGDIVYVELPEVGSEVKKGEQFGVIESVKVCLVLVLISAHKTTVSCSCCRTDRLQPSRVSCV